MAFVPVYILILAFTIVLDYFAGIYLEKTKSNYRKLFLILSLTANIGILAVFKYYNFFLDNITTVLTSFNISNPLPALQILLPIGLSFHTFQAMSYNIEVYRGNQKAEKHFGIYALYVLFYPQLVAGPIERPQNLLHQFRIPQTFNFERFKSGFTLIIFGLFKKVVIADRLAIAVDYAYKDPTQSNGLSLGIATIFYAFQIYCDFSGYSDIAIGTARIMGFNLMENFRTPYFAKSISEFWKRWHISLSTWFKDYVYIPLGGNKVKVSRWMINLLIVFIISGFWHGANWTFILWGALHGIFLIGAILLLKIKNHFNIHVPNVKWINIVITFSLVCFAWIFFRATSVEQALGIIQKISSTSLYDTITLGMHHNEIIYCMVLIIILLIKEKLYYKLPHHNNIQFFTLSSTLILLIYILGVFNQNQFIYFQF